MVNWNQSNFTRSKQRWIKSRHLDIMIYLSDMSDNTFPYKNKNNEKEEASLYNN